METQAGKTTFTRGIAKGLKITQTLHSPTYQIYNIYKGSKQLIHMDAYRLEGPDSLDALMIEDFLASPFLWVIEWPEKIAEVLPADAYHFHLWIDKEKHFIQRTRAITPQHK